MIGVRRATDADVPALRRLVNEAYRLLGDMGLNFTGVDQDEAITRRRMQGREVYVLEHEGKLIGTVNLVCRRLADGERYVEVTQLAVDPSFQRRGIGSRLMRLAEERALELDARRVRLDTAIPAEHLTRFYEGHGYVRSGETQHPGKTYRSVILEKRL